tara:strand:+ start:676 stop:1098 length:423 start_codon:yes stop_codon:yes gene_type:complete
MHACKNGHDRAIPQLIKKGVDVNQTNQTDGKGLAPLMLARLHGHDPCVRAMIDAGGGADATQTGGQSGETALMHACVENHEQCALQLLLMTEDVVDQVDNQGAPHLINAGGGGVDSSRRAGPLCSSWPAREEVMISAHSN